MNVAGMTLDEALRWLALWVGVLAVTVGFVVWRGRRRGRRTLALDTALTLSTWWVVLTALGLIPQLTMLLTYTELPLENVTVWAPWPGPTGACDLTTAAPADPAIVCASLRTATLQVTGIDLGPRWLLAGGRIFGSILLAIPGVMLALIAWNALRGKPFAVAVPRALYVGAVAMIVAGFAAAVLTGIGEGAVLSAVLPVDGVDRPPVSFEMDPLIFGGALALAALGAVFQHGARLQKETEGLV